MCAVYLVAATAKMGTRNSNGEGGAAHHLPIPSFCMPGVFFCRAGLCVEYRENGMLLFIHVVGIGNGIVLLM